jgi:hypothetical protein
MNAADARIETSSTTDSQAPLAEESGKVSFKDQKASSFYMPNDFLTIAN